MPGLREDDGYDDQDNAETFDEANLDDREQVGEMRTFEEMPDLFDATRAYGDRDDDEGRSMDAADFDEEEFDVDALEEDDELNYRASADDFDDVIFTREYFYSLEEGMQQLDRPGSGSWNNEMELEYVPPPPDGGAAPDAE